MPPRREAPNDHAQAQGQAQDPQAFFNQMM